MSGESRDAAETPTPAEIAAFVETFGKLDAFEAQSRQVRGYGAFGPEMPLPIPGVAKVLAWLNGMSA